MGVRGLFQYVLRHKDRGATQATDLVWEAHQAGRSGVTLLVELSEFAVWVLPQVDRLAKEYCPDGTFAVYGGEFAYHDEVISAIVFGLRAANVFLEFFVDAPRGCGLVDAAAGGWSDEAKHKYGAELAVAKAARQWARGERADMATSKDGEAYCLPPLWYEQTRASLSRCGCHVWHLRPDEQAPLLSLGRNSDWGHVWGVVSDNIDWAVVRGIKLIPFQCFDLDGQLVATALSSSGWPEVARLSVAYTSADLLAELLRLGHPPRPEEVEEAKGKGKGRGPVGYGQWPYKWWNEQVLVEVALLCGTEATTHFLQKHKLYEKLYLNVGADPMDAILRWLRNQLYTNKLRWRDVQLESLSPVIADLVQKDNEFRLALEASRAVYRQHVSGVRAVYSEVMQLKEAEGELKEKSIVSMSSQGNHQELPEAASLLLRSAANGRRVWLQVHFEDVIRNGAPLAHMLLSDLRRLTYLFLRRQGAAAIQEHGIAAEQRTGLQSVRVGFDTDLTEFPTLEGIQNWTFNERWALFRRIVEHNLLQANAMDWSNWVEGEAPPPRANVEEPVWQAYQSAQNCPACTVASFLHSTLEYFVSLNHRPELPLIREHEFDSMAALVALSCDASLPGAPLEEAPEWAQQRFGEIKGQLWQLISGNFHQTCEIHIPLRVSVLAAWFQGAMANLLDLARLLWLDVSENGEAPLVWLPEPREIFSGSLFAALYCGGAYDAWELKMPESASAYQWKAVFKQLSTLRGEIVASNWFRSWKQRFMSGLPRGTILWPTSAELHKDAQNNVEGMEELPIDEHRQKILAHIDKHRVTCIQGETGCGKSTRVPVFVMEEYFEKKKKGTLENEDKFMVLCTQPRRIACISLAQRVATCLNQKVGDTIGYKISGDSKVRPGRTKLVYVTTGYLLQVLVNNPEQIKNYSHLILDEVHERDVDSDLLSLVVKLQMTGYPFKLVVMSATLQGDLFSRYFSEKKIKTIFVGVKRFPVEVLYLENLLDRYGGRSGWDERAIPDGARGLQAPFSHQAMRAIRDCERQFGTGYDNGKGLEADAYEQPANHKGEFDSSDESSSSDDDSDFSGQEDNAAEKKAAAKQAKKAGGWQNRRKEVMPQIQRGLDVLVYELITRVANPGEGILIFLPGIGEITELHETLMSLEDPERASNMTWDPSLPRTDVRFKVFVLHSLIPKDEQEGAVFDPPAPDCCHVILSSNIAESSLTIPKIRIVIDFGLRRQLVYDKRRHMSCLVTRWVSQASAKQRTGRTGRVFEGVNIRLFTKNYMETFMEEFDPPEMQTAPLEKLYVNVKHLSAKLPEYQITPTEKRRRTPKELLSLVAQPPDPANIDTSIKVLDDLGALTGPSEEASLTALGYLMMTVPLDVQLCRLVIFGAILNMPCDGVVLAAGLSVQDPFTLPSHLIIKDPREYAEALKRSYDSRAYFDHGHQSEPLMLRAVFVQWLSEFRQQMVDRSGGRGGRRRETPRQLFTKAAQAMSSKFAIVPKRVTNYANSVLDTSQRMRKFIPSGSEQLKKLDGMVALLQAGDTWYSSTAEAEEKLPKLSDIFSEDVLILKCLLVISFTGQFMCGSTKIRNDEPQQPQEMWGKKTKQKKLKVPKKEPKGKIDLLLDEILQHGLDPSKTVHCQLEIPRGRGGKWLPRLNEDLHLTFSMVTCGKPFNLVMSGENKCFICFDTSDVTPSPYVGLAEKLPLCAKLEEEEALAEDLPEAAHYIDLYGAGRFKFQVPLLSIEQKERETAKKEAAKKEREDAAKGRALAKSGGLAAKGKGKDKNNGSVEAKSPEGKVVEEEEVVIAAPVLNLSDALVAEDTDAGNAKEAEAEEAKAEETGAEAPTIQEVDGADAQKAESAKPEDVAADSGNKDDAASPEPAVPAPADDAVPAPSADTPALPDDMQVPAMTEEQAAGALAAMEVDAEAEHEEEVAALVDNAEDLGPMIGIYKPLSPYEVNWEVIDPHAEQQEAVGKKGKPKKKKVTKGRCNWRNALGFLGSCKIPDANRVLGMKPEPWPNDMYAVYTNTQGGESKDLSWVDGVTVLPAEKDNLISFILLIAFLRYNQDLSFDVDLQDGRIHAIHGVGGLDLTIPEQQVLLVEDVEKINAVRVALSKGFWTQEKVTVAEEDKARDSLDFTGYQSRRDDEVVPQICVCDAGEKLKELIQSLREIGNRNNTITQQEWNSRFLLRKPTHATLDMHRFAARNMDRNFAPSDENFVLFEPLADLVQAKIDAERHEREEEWRKQQAEADKRRKKEEEHLRKTQDKKAKKMEEMRRKQEEERERKLAAKGKGKAKAKSRSQQQQQQADSWWDEPAEPTPKAKSKAKAKAKAEKGGKGKGKDEVEPQQSKKGGKKGGGKEAAGGQANLPPHWAMVPDANTGRYYYWNQLTNETSWTPPAATGSSPTSSPSNAASMQPDMAAFMQQQQAFYMAQQMAAYQSQFPGSNPFQNQ